MRAECGIGVPRAGPAIGQARQNEIQRQDDHTQQQQQAGHGAQFVMEFRKEQECHPCHKSQDTWLEELVMPLALMIALLVAIFHRSSFSIMTTLQLI